VDTTFRFYSCTGSVVRDDPEEDVSATLTPGIYHVIMFHLASAFLYSDILLFTSCDITCVILDRNIIVQQYFSIC